MRLQGKVAIVTGAGSGFGEGMAERFAAEGAKVVVADINDNAGRTVAERIGEAALFTHTDVSDNSSVEAMIGAALDAFGRVDILVNNAGWTHDNTALIDVPEEDFDRVFAVNVKSIYLGARHAVPVMRSQGGGMILNIASTAGVRPRPGLVWYNGTKGAAITITRAMAVELAPDNIRVCAINPVIGDTGLTAKFMGGDTPEKRAQFTASIPLGRMSQPRDIANTALFLCSDEADFLTGTCVDVDGGRCV